MKIQCKCCERVYDIPDERLPFGENVSFPCPACKKTIEINLKSKTGSECICEDTEAATAPRKQKAAYEPECRTDGSGDFSKGEALKKTILRCLKELPPMPQVMLKAKDIMNDPKSDFRGLSDILESDQAMATRVLRLSNSAYYGLAGKVTSLQHAAVLLGYQTVGEIISIASSSTLLGNSLGGYRLGSGDLWHHSLAVAIASRKIAGIVNPEIESDAFAAGLIHDAGKLVLDKYLMERSLLFDKYMADGSKTFLEAEKAILGFDHGEIAADVCKSWKIPFSLVSAICNHHRPSRSNENMLTCIIHTADSLALKKGIGAGMDGMLYKTDEKALEVVGIDEEKLEDIIEDTAESVEKITSEMQ